MKDAFEVKSSQINGKGLFAVRTIEKGETVTKWNPKKLTKQEASMLPEDEQRHYLYPDGESMLWMQPPERYMNHSCDANTRVVNKSDVATRVIKVGEEITSDYIDVDTEDFECNCGSIKCRGKSRAL